MRAIIIPLAIDEIMRRFVDQAIRPGALMASVRKKAGRVRKQEGV